jgi:hypothetical protein
VYFGIPLGLLDFSSTGISVINLPIYGQTAWSELELLAEVCGCHLFVQVGGLLTLSPWKDDNSSVDLVLPPELIASIDVVRTVERGPTRLFIKGKWTSMFGCGPALLTNSEGDEPQFETPKCYITGVKEATSQLHMKNIAASKTDLINAAYLTDGDLFQFIRPATQNSNGSVSFSVNNGVDSTPAGVVQRTHVKILARRQDGDKGEKTSHKGKTTKAVISRQDRVFSKLMGLPPGSAFPPEADADRTSDSGDENRQLVAIIDTDLESEFGVIPETIDNQYVNNSLAAIAIAIRKFQEFKMRRKRYKVTSAYIAGLRLNQVVTFPTIQDPDVTITGRVASINVSYSPASSGFGMTMTFEVDSFEDIGNTIYTAGNLFVYPECCGINGVDWFKDGEVYAVAGHFAIKAGSAIGQRLYTIPGADYSITVEAKLLSDVGTFRIDYYNNGTFIGSSASISSNQSLNLSFVAPGSVTEIYFVAVAGDWAVTNPLATILITA